MADPEVSSTAVISIVDSKTSGNANPESPISLLSASSCFRSSSLAYPPLDPSSPITLEELEGRSVPFPRAYPTSFSDLSDPASVPTVLSSTLTTSPDSRQIIDRTHTDRHINPDLSLDSPGCVRSSFQSSQSYTLTIPAAPQLHPSTLTPSHDEFRSSKTRNGQLPHWSVNSRTVTQTLGIATRSRESIISNLSVGHQESSTPSTSSFRSLSMPPDTFYREPERVDRKELKKLKVHHHLLWSEIGQITHDIRNPLMSLIGGISILSDLLERVDDEKLREEANEVLTEMRFAANVQRSILNQSVDLTKLETGTLSIHPETKVELFPLLHSLTQILVPEAEQNNSILQLAPGVEELARGMFVVVDPFRVEQILMKLVSNAVRFTKDGTVTIDFSFKRSVRDSNLVELRFSITDTGIGIESEEISRLFQKFTQANESIQAEFGGSGVGLYLSQGIAELLGGEILVESELGVGSTFSLVLSDITLSETETKTEEEEDPEKVDEKGVIVWHADDQKVNRTIIDFFLRGTEFTLTLFVNGKELVDAYMETPEADRPSIIILDLNMPVLGGLEACRELVEMETSAKLYCLSANFSSETEAMCLRAGFAGLLGKPISRDELLDVLRTAHQATSERILTRTEIQTSSDTQGEDERRQESDWEDEDYKTALGWEATSQRGNEAEESPRKERSVKKTPRLSLFHVVAVVLVMITAFAVVCTIRF